MYKSIISLIIIAITINNLKAQTIVSGEQSGIWTAENSPYIVEDTITVPNGQILEIQPGVKIIFQGHYKFYINGTLKALGEEGDSIIFTAQDTSQGWYGIHIKYNNNLSIFKYCRFEYGITTAGSYPDQHGGAIVLINSDAIFEHCVFENNKAFGDDNGMGGAIYCLNTENSRFSNCIFRNNSAYGEGGAIKFSGDNGSEIDSCIFINNSVFYGGGAICLYGCYGTRFFRDLFYNNKTIYSAGGAALIEEYSSQISFVNCTIYDNKAQNGDGGGINITFSDANFTNSIIYNNPGLYSNDIHLDYGNAEINYCDVLPPDEATGENNIYVNPLFTDPQNENFTLSENSLCIDKGIDTLTITDASNNEITVIELDSSQYYGNMPDIGCFEFIPTPTYSQQITYISVKNLHNLLIIKNANGYNATLYNLYAQIIYKKNICENYQTMDVSNLPQGVYLLYLSKGKYFHTYKFIKQ